MRVLSFNIWADAPPNVRWKKRREKVAEILRMSDASLMGLQEATRPMISDLEEALKDWKWIGAGRDDGLENGEFNPIFYRPDQLRLLDHGTFWLSASPDQPCKGWDAACFRIVTWGHFQNSASGKECFHFNTHFDHLGSKARQESALLLLKYIREITRDRPTIVTGDFNCRESSIPYRILTGQPPYENDFILKDSYYHTKTAPLGPRKTFRGLLSFLGMGRIDYIFTTSDIEVSDYIVHDSIRNASDHLPVMAQIQKLSCRQREDFHATVSG